MTDQYLLVMVKGTLVGFVLSWVATAAFAQGPGAVVESQPVVRGGSSVSQQSPTNNDALALLLEQNRQLQAEVQALRGMVEEQGFELRKLQRDSLSRYTDTDDRLRNLETATNGQPAVAVAPDRLQDTGGGLSASRPADQGEPAAEPTAPGVGPATDMAQNAAVAPEQPSAPRGTLQPAVLSEQQLYQMAYDSVINSNFERSIAEFDQYLSIYPQGRFVTNAFYWKGQAFLYLNRYAEARDSYEVILNEYTDSAKLPDAMYGLGLAYQGLGNIPQARQLLNDIKRRFPNTGVANLADTRLLTLD
jgi:tol-pal system protein YbgF